MAFHEDFERFINWLPGARLIDRLGGPLVVRQKQADFILSNGEVVGELKQLTSDSAEAVNRCWEKVAAAHGVSLRTHEEIEAFLRRAENPDRFRLDAIRAAAVRMEADLKDANRQIKASKSRFELPEAIGLVVVVNEGNQTLFPEAAIWAASMLLRRKKEGQPLLRSIDALWYLGLFEGHVLSVEDMPASLSLTFMRDDSNRGVSAAQVCRRLQIDWSRFARIPLFVTDASYRGGTLEGQSARSLGFRAGLPGRPRPMESYLESWAGSSPEFCKVCSADIRSRGKATRHEEPQPGMWLMWFECPENGCAADIRVADAVNDPKRFGKRWIGTYPDLLRGDWRELLEPSD